MTETPQLTNETHQAKDGLALIVPCGMPRLVFDFSAVRRQMIAERRKLIVEVAGVLKGAGFSGRSIAASFHLCPSALTDWMQRYERGGLDALRPKPHGRKVSPKLSGPITFTASLLS